jgi:hypothetical protein
MMNSFWWGHSYSKNKRIHWLSWDKLTIHKNEGGMSFKNLHAFNLSLLGKQGWHLMTNQNSLVSRLFKAKYFLSCSFLNSKIGHNPSVVGEVYVKLNLFLEQVIDGVLETGLIFRCIGEVYVKLGADF